MKKIIFKSIVLTLIVAVGGLYYVWQEATKVPDEYTEAISADRSADRDLPLQVRQVVDRVTVTNSKIVAPIETAQSGQKVAVKLNNEDLNNLVVGKVLLSHAGKQVRSGIKGIKTNIKDGKIHTGALVNLEQITKDSTLGSQTAALNKLTDRLPFLKDRDVYVGIVGKPIVNGSRIEFDKDTQIKVGNMNFTIAQLAENLGVSEAKIQRAIEIQLQQQNFKVDRIGLENNELKIEGARK